VGIQFNVKGCCDLQFLRSREWLITNGIGGYASSTVAAMNTRRYHGLLVAATAPPLGRLVLLSQLEDILVVDGTRFSLCTNLYAGDVRPTDTSISLTSISIQNPYSPSVTASGGSRRKSGWSAIKMRPSSNIS
jgi:predicted glycogen debranching enzyme